MMKQSGLQFTERQLLRIVEELGAQGQWKQALSVVEWVYSNMDNRRYKSRSFIDFDIEISKTYRSIVVLQSNYFQSVLDMEQSQ